MAGVLVGADLNYAVLDSVAEAAYEAYRERYLRDKAGLSGDGNFDDLPGVTDDTEPRLGVLEVLDDEGFELEA